MWGGLCWLTLLPLQSFLCLLPINLTGLHFHLEFRRWHRNKEIDGCVQHWIGVYFYFLLALASVALLILFFESYMQK